jgi:hypothetical protein
MIYWYWYYNRLNHNHYRHRIIIYFTVTYLINTWQDLLRLARKSLSFPNVWILTLFMYLLVVLITPQSGVTTYAYVDCHISFDCVCRQQFNSAGTCVLSRNKFSHVLLVPGYGQLSLWYLAKQISQTRSTSLVRLLLRLLQGWILRLYSNQNFILGSVKTCRTIFT